jgi:hypothetical protein
MNVEFWSIVVGWVLALIAFFGYTKKRSEHQDLQKELATARTVYNRDLESAVDRFRREAVNAGVALWEVDKYGTTSFWFIPQGCPMIVTSADLTGYPIQSGDFRVTKDMLRVDKEKFEKAELVIYLGLSDGRYQVVKQRGATLLESLRSLG